MVKLEDSIKEYYDNVANIYNVKHGVDLYGCQWGIKKYYLPLIKRFIPGNSEILEIGCGTGKYTEILKKGAKRICGVDISPEMIKMAKKRNPDVQFIVANCETLLDFKEEEFDVVAGLNVFSYFQNKPKALSSINRVLKRGGIFFDLDMNGLSPFYYLMSFIKKNELEKWHNYIKESTLQNLSLILDKAGFDIIHKDTLNWIPNALNKPMVSLLIPADLVFSHLSITKRFAMRIIILGRKR